MKKMFFLFIFICLFAVGCGTAKDKTNALGGSEPGNEGTGIETLPADDELSEPMEDIYPLLKQLTYDAQVTVNGNTATFHMQLTNTASEKIKLGFSSGQQFEIVVRDASTNDELYRYSEGMMFTEALVYEELNPNDALTWSYDWNFEGKNGKVTAPDLVATVIVMPMNLNDIPIDANPFIKELSFSNKSQENTTNQSHAEYENTAFRNISISGSEGSYTISGEARVFEAQFAYNVEDGHHILIEETFYQTPEGAPSWSPFEINVDLKDSRLPINGTVSLVLYERSANDGSIVNELFIPLEHIK